MSSQLNRYWIPNFDINKRGEDGYLISTPGECLTDVSTIMYKRPSERTDRRYLYQVEGALGEAGSGSSQERVRQATKAASAPTSHNFKRLKAPFLKVPSAGS
ncbi:uncharacterized protein EAE98_003893 [Botrytis deweyae]|uniref:Uncharacterized protein n=1 Tax=Botrytis deweyae TaxID=2478750 RepID=A0ABQ7IS73_9HELO|nr:uncharacterized protein EAE98_003893 [Botrytis deweyae]KAF7932594.1 hypothetical protein EAE98_003893 [Botrytis deweyae]